MTEDFTRHQFEITLNAIANTLQMPVEYQGVVWGEYQYRLRIRSWLWIRVRSSVLSSTRRSANCGENSIRVSLVDIDGEPIASNLKRYINRTSGWEKRMETTISQVKQFAQDIRACCGEPEHKRRASDNGKWFLTCKVCKSFRWALEGDDE